MEVKDIDKKISFVNKKRKRLLPEIRREQELLEYLNEKLSIDTYLSLIEDYNATYDNVNDYLKYREKFTDHNFYEKVLPILQQIPDSNGSRYYQQINLNIGIIADTFLYQSYKDVAYFWYITPDNYKQFLGKIDLLLIATTWKGLNGEWSGVANRQSARQKELLRVIDFFKKSGVLVAFYSKEDPANYEKFIHIAKKCDCIFTTCLEIIGSYKKDCKTEKVYLLPFGVNPMYHNPIGMRKFPKRKEILFAGSWYEKYEHRKKETEMIFDGVLESGKDLKIIDRNYHLNQPDYFFPKKYLSFVSPAIHHKELQKLHKLFDYAINLNSVKHSETMFANRVYELQALGNILLSNYSVGVNNHFPNVFLINNQSEVKDILSGYTKKEIYQQQVQGIRRVMSSDTTFQRLEYMLDCMNFNYRPVDRKVAVVVKEKEEQNIRNFERQSYPEKSLILEQDFNDKVKSQYDIIAFFHPDRFYGEYYLEDLINAFKYTDSDYITKDSYYEDVRLIKGIEHDYVHEVKDKYRTVFWSDSFSAEELLNLNHLKQLPNGYSIDPFEFNTSKTTIKMPISKYSLSVIVPVYNNGQFLLNKCFNSLRRSSIFEQMEIILVDDGSTDQQTISIIQRLERTYSNVKTFFFRDDGSGSASRPRNKGLALSTAPYITFLDPDNEAINDGYSKLLKEIKNNDVDMVVGNILRIDNSGVKTFNYYNLARKLTQNNLITEPKQFLKDTNLRAHSIQALVVKRNIIEKNNLKMVTGAAGQDTLFFWELLLNTTKSMVVNELIHIYYAAITGSVTNSISKSFYEKYLILEQHRIPFLKKEGLFEVYLEGRFTFYFINWYLKRLGRMDKKHIKEAVESLYKIYSLYEGYLKNPDEIIQIFVESYKTKNYDRLIEKIREL